MKKRFIPIVAFTIFAAVSSCKDNASTKISDAEVTQAKEMAENAGKLPVLAFDKTEHDFGVINEGDKVTTEFTVTNSGEADLVIINAQASCGCTVPDYKKEPIKPGESTPIKVTFDSNGKPGQQQKTITLTTNTANGKEICTIKANVTPKNPNNTTPTRGVKQ